MSCNNSELHSFTVASMLSVSIRLTHYSSVVTALGVFLRLRYQDMFKVTEGTIFPANTCI